MLALVAIPHQRPASVTLYDDIDGLIESAYEKAEKRGDFAFIDSTPDVHAAAHYLGDDWNGYLVIDSELSLGEAMRHTEKSKGHQWARVLGLLEGVAPSFA